MIPVIEKPEPPDFEEKVRKKGKRFLEKTSSPTSTQWNSHDYWTNASENLYKEYGGICAYSAFGFDDFFDGNVDHFIPKSKKPMLAYEWKNYRLSTSIMNSYKGVSQEVLDPFELKPGWFVLDFPSLYITSGSFTSSQEKERIEKTIKILKLNEKLVKVRRKWVIRYCKEKISFCHLKEQAPFIALELENQGLKPIKDINERMKLGDHYHYLENFS